MYPRYEGTRVPMAEAGGYPERRRVVIAGAAGRDFHNFNVAFRDDPAVDVVAFTAAQIPGIASRRYPAELAGPLYPKGIAIADERELEQIVGARTIDEVVFAYSDVSHLHVMHVASRALAAGADFILLGPRRTMLPTHRPVIAVCAVRTGCGKSPIARWIAKRLNDAGKRVAVVRHPMPYGDLARQRCQRFAKLSDLDAASCTAEEREEYEPHLAAGLVVHAGVDYVEILRRVEAEADVIVWDGGNNDFPFFRPECLICVVDALRPDQAGEYHPGETVLRLANVVLVNKIDAIGANPARAAAAARAINPAAEIIMASSRIDVEGAAQIGGRRVIVVDDGPTLTHGGMPYGAGYVGAVRAGAIVVDPRPRAPEVLAAVYRAHPHIGPVLPAIGYTPEHLDALASAIASTPAEYVVSGTPLDLARLLAVAKPVMRARYGFCEPSDGPLGRIVDAALDGTTAR